MARKFKEGGIYKRSGKSWIELYTPSDISALQMCGNEEIYKKLRSIPQEYLDIIEQYSSYRTAYLQQKSREAFPDSIGSSKILLHQAIGAQDLASCIKIIKWTEQYDKALRDKWNLPEDFELTTEYISKRLYEEDQTATDADFTGSLEGAMGKPYTAKDAEKAREKLKEILECN